MNSRTSRWMACVKEINSSRVELLKVPSNDLKKERKRWLALGVTSGPRTNLSTRTLEVMCTSTCLATFIS